MKFGSPALIALIISGCGEPNMIEPYCGRPADVWIPAENTASPHQIVEHKIEVTHIGQILLNHTVIDTQGLEAFLAQEEKKRPMLPYLYFDFDAHADCVVVKETRALIERSGICRQGYCITGDDGEEPPRE